MNKKINANNIPILYYHSVAPRINQEWIRSFLTTKLSEFESLIRYLLIKKYKFLSIDEYLDHSKKSVNSNDRLICLTFDDGYLDNYVFAFPILMKYNAKATIFVNPEFVQDRLSVRPTIKDTWKQKIHMEELSSIGFASWGELKLMQDSGVVDIQSHTMTHAKYYVSDQLRDFHHLGADCLNPILNLFPSIKPYYANDTKLIWRIPWGTPFFEEKSSVIARRVHINRNFEQECIYNLKLTDWSKYSFKDCMKRVNDLYLGYQSKGDLIVHTETTAEYEFRVRKELGDSKQVLEEKLGKPVLHCCWPHGDYNEFAHQAAIEAGYRSTGIVLKPGDEDPPADRFHRIGAGAGSRHSFFGLIKNIYKIQSYRGVFPYRFVQSIHNRVKYGIG
jgi:hypothetical protein